MRHPSMVKILQKKASYIILSFFLLITASIFAQTTDSTPKPSVTVWLNKQTLRENDCVTIQVWLKNENNIKIDKAELNLSLPEQLKKSAQGCKLSGENPADNAVIALNVINAQNDTKAENVLFREIYVKSDSNITVGDYNLLFNVTYWWTDKKQSKYSLIAVEKPVKVNFLGSDAVAGVPLGLAGFIVPGLFFWLILNLFGVSWAKDKGLGDKLIYSVLVSFLLIGIASLLYKIFPIEFFRSLDISNGISLERMLRLAFAGAVAGIIVSGIELVKAKLKQRREAQIIVGNLPDKEKIKRFLKESPEFNPGFLKRLMRQKTDLPEYKFGKVVKTKSEDVYTGAIGEKGEKLIFLIGWTKIEVAKDNPILSELKDCEERNLLYRLFDKAEKNNLNITEKQPVVLNDDYNSNQGWVKIFKEDDFIEIADDTKQNKVALKPFTIEEI